MAGHSHLLVPITLQALVVNRQDLSNTMWSVSRRTFGAAEHREPEEPPPFARGTDRPRLGITLHWSLPDALTRGRRDSANALKFPFVPNRWLVVRQRDNAFTTGPVLRAWILESDYLASDGTNLYPGPGRSGVMGLGRSFPLSATGYDDQTLRQTPFLTAVGGFTTAEGGAIDGDDPAFAAHVATVDNVLSFHDGLMDLGLFDPAADPPKDQPAVLSYTVIGWHSQSDSDPMNGVARMNKPWSTEEEWRRLLEAYEWQANNVDADASLPRLGLPAETVYHGSVFSVRWTGRERGEPQSFLTGRTSPFAESTIASRRRDNPALAQPPASLRTAKAPHIAVGNSATDALAALVDYLTDDTAFEPNDDDANIANEKKSHTLGRLVQAIQYNATDRYNEPGGRLQLDDDIHSSWFHPISSGTEWEVVEPRDPDKSETAPAPIPAAVVNRLALLNSHQKELDSIELHFNSSVRELYEQYWKLWRLGADPQPPSKTGDRPHNVVLTARVASLLDELLSMEGRLTDVQSRRQTAEAELRSAVKAVNDGAGSTKPGLELRRTAAGRFQRPADPVVLIYGLKRALHKHGGDGRESANKKLLCRVTSQTIRSFAEGTDSLSREDLDSPFDLPRLLASLPSRLSAAIGDLLAEWLLLSPLTGSHLIAAGKANMPSLATAQMAVWSDFTAQGMTPADIVTASGFSGTRPAALSVDRWTQPWMPIHLAWRVSYFPSGPDRSVTEVMNRWEFDGFEFRWTGIADAGHADAFQLEGRTLLNPLNTRTALDALADLEAAARKVGGTVPADQVDRLRETLASADLVAQTLTGFHDMLTRRDPYFQMDFNRFGVQEPRLSPEIRKRLASLDPSAPMPFDNPGRQDFQAIRAGHFRLLRLWVVDAFGQVFDPIAERFQRPESFVPLRGSGLAIRLNGNPTFTATRTQRQDTQQLQAPPRLLQPARLRARLEHDDDPSASALCGWILPNHFDKSLAVYDRDGELLGALLLSGGSGAPSLRWDPAVTGSGASVTTPTMIRDVHLAAFVTGLARQTNAGGAFNDLMETIDRTLWGIDPLGQRGDNLSVLIGRPVAILRMSVALELETPPRANPSWLAPAGDSKGMSDARFPVAIGHDELRDDGTLGYFVDGDDRFHAIHRFTPDADYVVKADARRDVLLRMSWPGLAEDRRTWVTVLADPRGGIRLRTGILPTEVVRLPRELVDRARRQMDVTFRIGPLLNEADGLRMPLPAEIQGGWSWIERSGIQGLTEIPVTPASHHATMSDAPIVVREGWLRLSDSLAREEER